MKKYILGIGMMLSMVLVSCGDDEIFDEDAQLETDIILIEDFLETNGLEADTLKPSEIRIIIDDPGDPEKADFGSTVYTHYSGYLLDGTQFDSSEGGPPFTFVMDRGDVIQGWDIAFKELGKGGRATFFIPSQYGYGNRGQRNIPANSVLIFEVSVIDLR